MQDEFNDRLSRKRQSFQLVGQRCAKGDNGHQRSYILLSHGRNPPKLLHQAQGIEVGPLFGDLATHEAKDIGAGKRHVLPSWRETLKDSFMRTTPGVANRYLVSLSDQVLSRELEVGEAGGVRDHQLFGLLDASDGRPARKV